MHLRNLDLNLLVVFRAMMAHRSATLAAAELLLSPSAVSHALRRLREQYGDPLFIRSGRDMMPTPRALELLEPVEASLRQIEETFHREFDPGRMRREFRVGLVNFEALYLAPALTGKLATDAPHSRIVPAYLSVDETTALLNAGELDLAIGQIPQRSPDHLRVRLFVDRYCIIAAADHPQIGTSISSKALSKLGHVAILTMPMPADAFAQGGVGFTVAARVDSMLSAIFAVARSDLIAVIPTTVARMYEGICDLKVIEAPLQLEACVIDLVYHRRSEADEAHRWLRNLVVDLALELGSRTGTMRRASAADVPKSNRPKGEAIQRKVARRG